MKKRSLIVLGLGATLCAKGVGQGVWLQHNLFDRIQLSGYRQLGFHMHQVQGDRNTFNALNYSGLGGREFTDIGSVTVIGNDVVGLLNFRMTFTDGRFDDPENKQFSVNYNNKGFSVDAGDIQANLLNTNSLASVSRSLKGISAGYQSKTFGVKVLHSATKASARTITINGNNSTGPYYIQNGRLVTGSETVQVDGVDQQINQDYTIDYVSGSINFVRSIASTSTILMTYEAYDFNVAAGSVTGASMSYSFGKVGRVGLTHIRSTSGTGNGLTTRSDQFEGFGAPTAGYPLQAIPMNTPQFPTIVRVDGIRQTEGVDYVFDANIPSLMFMRRFIPSTSIVEVIYYPRPTSVADGNREVTGFDYKVPIGPEGSFLQYSQANSRLTNTVTPLAGTARTIGGSYRNKGLKVSANWHQIPDDFVSVESRGFNRNDTGYNTSLEYKKGAVTYTASHSKSAIGNRVIQGDGSTSVSRSDETQGRAGMLFTKDRVSWGADLSTISSSRPDYRTQLNTLSLYGSQRNASANKKPVRFQSSWGLDQQTGYLDDGSRKNLTLNTARYNLTFKPSTPWTFSSQTSLSRTQFNGQSGTGRDLSLGFSYRPGEKFALDGRVIDSDGGEFATLSGFNGAYGTGYNGNGFSSGLGSTNSIGGTNVRSYSLTSTYRPNQRQVFDARVELAKSSGGYSSNTQSTVFGFGTDIDLGKGYNGGLRINNTVTKFLGGSYDSKSTYLEGYLSGHPAGPWSYRLGGNILLSSGGTFGQNSIFADASLTYRVDSSQNLGFRLTGSRSTGYLPQNDSLMSLFYEHQLYRNVSLIGSYKIRALRNLDPIASSQGYSSRGFDLELSFAFGG